MTIKIDIVEGAILAADATTNLTISGFGVVKGAIILAMVAPASNVNANNAQLSMGFYDGHGTGLIDQVACSFSSQDGQANSDERRNTGLGRAVYLCGTAPTMASSQSVENITDGLMFTKDNANTDIWVRCIFFGGTGLEVAPLYGQDLSSVTSPATVSGMSVSPNLLFGMTTAMSGLPADTADVAFSFGVSALHEGATLRQYCNNYAANDGSPDTSQVHRATFKNSHFMSSIDNAGSPFFTLDIDSFNSDGFTYSWTDLAGSKVWYGLAISILDPTKIHLGQSSISASATSWVSGAADYPPIFGMMGQIDGVTGVGTEFTSVGALTFTWATAAKCFVSSFLMDPAGTGTATQAKQRRTSALGNWTIFLKSIAGVIQGAAGTFSFSGSNELSLASLSGVPARNTALWYLMIADHIENIQVGPDEIFAVYQGSTPVTGAFKGTNQIF